MKIYRKIIKFLAPERPNDLFVLYFLTLGLVLEWHNVHCCVIFGTEQLEESLCKTKVCANYGRCKIDENGFFAKCVCPTDCSTDSPSDVDYDLAHSVVNLPASIASAVRNGAGGKTLKKKKRLNGGKGGGSVAAVSELFNQVVCGSNGQDYKNFCELKKHSCRQNRESKIFYFGKCSKLKLYYYFTFNWVYFIGLGVSDDLFLFKLGLIQL
jgi:hypothetical protein